MRDPIKQDGIDLVLRQTYIGSSEWATTAGLFNKYKTPYQVWNEKINGYIPFDNLRMRLGRDIEPMIAKWVEEDKDVHVARDGVVRFHPEYDFLATNLDGIIYHKTGSRPSVFEIKTVGVKARESWDAKLPLNYYTQIQGQMLISGLHKAYVAIATFGFNGVEDFEIQEYDFNQEFTDMVVAELVSFWNDHVLTGIPPAPVNNDDLKIVYPESNGNGIMADDKLVSQCEMLQQFKQTRSEVDLSIKDLELAIKTIMGDNEFLVDNKEATLATWKSGVGRSSFDSKTFKQDHPDLYNEYTKQSGSIRTFRLK